MSTSRTNFVSSRLVESYGEMIQDDIILVELSVMFKAANV